MFKNKKRIDFMIIGVQKSGTSVIHKYLSSHPDIYMPPAKELHFFDCENNERLFFPYKRYHKHFDFKKSQLMGEATPIYIYWKDSLPKIKKYNPSIKLILILRNPIDRAFSQWNMELQKGREHRSFEDCIINEIKGINANKYEQHRIKSYVDRGLYHKQLLNLFNLFPRENIHIDFYYNLIENEKGFVERILFFLNLNQSNYFFEKKKDNVMKYNHKMTETEKNILIEFYKNDIQKLEILLNTNLTSWYQ